MKNTVSTALEKYFQVGLLLGLKLFSGGSIGIFELLDKREWRKLNTKF